MTLLKMLLMKSTACAGITRSATAQGQAWVCPACGITLTIITTYDW